MAAPLIEDHALLSDQRSTALVTRDGDVNWLCLPRFDSDAVFCSLLGDDEHGHWSLRIADGEVISRRDLPGTMVLETQWRSPTGAATVTEFMPIAEDDSPVVGPPGGEATGGAGSTPGSATSLRGDVEDHADLFRMVACTSGEVEVLQELRIRFEYGLAVPWVRKGEDVDGEPVLIAIAGGDAVALHGPALTAGEGRCHEGRHRLRAGEETAWILTWFPSWLEVPPARDPRTELERTCAQWTGWLGQVRVDEEHARPVERSLLVLRALTHRRTGGIVAAATTSLPEDFGGERNWDYRYCWLRDAALSLEALLTHGHVDAAAGWREWLLRAIAGDPERLQIMYSITGDRETARAGARAPARLRGLAAGADRQRRRRAVPGRRGGRGDDRTVDDAGRRCRGDAVVLAAAEGAGALHVSTAWTSPTRASGRCGVSRRSSPTAG